MSTRSHNGTRTTGAEAGRVIEAPAPAGRRGEVAEGDDEGVEARLGEVAAIQGLGGLNRLPRGLRPGFEGRGVGGPSAKEPTLESQRL
jgi:hypothetical protein